MPTVDDTTEELKIIAQEALVKFGLAKDEDVQVKKYRNCVFFQLEYYQMVWYFEGTFYLGELSKMDGVSEKNGYGIEIIPDSRYQVTQSLCMKASSRRGRRKDLGRLDIATTTSMRESG